MCVDGWSLIGEFSETPAGRTLVNPTHHCDTKHRDAPFTPKLLGERWKVVDADTKAKH
jgi:hypothetical protein